MLRVQKLGAVWAVQPCLRLQKAFPSSGIYLNVFNKTTELFFPRTQQVCQAQPRSLLFHVGSPRCVLFNKPSSDAITGVFPKASLLI